MFIKEFKSRLERSSRTTLLEFEREITGQASHKSVQPSGKKDGHKEERKPWLLS